MDKRSSKKRPVGRPRGKRPMIAMRIDHDLFGQLEVSAKARKIPVAADAANRLRQSFDWDKQFGSISELQAHEERVIASGKVEAMRAWGIEHVRGRPGHFVETSKISQEEIVALNPALEALIERVVLRTLAGKGER